MTDVNSLGSAIRISTTLVKSLAAYVSALGIQESQVLAGTAVSSRELQDIDGLVSEEEYDTIFHNCVVLSGDPFLGLHLGKNLTLQQLGVLGFLLMNAENFRDALLAYERFQSTLGESVVLKVEVFGPIARVSFTLFGGLKTGQHRLESFYSSLRAAAWELTGRELQFAKVGSTYSPTHDSHEYQRILGLIPTQTQTNFVEFSADFLRLLIVNSVPDLTPIFETKILDRKAADQTLSLARQVKRELLKRVGKAGLDSLDDLSHFFGMSERSFQMKLEKEGLSFRKLHDEVRAEFALRHLKGGSPVSEISYALGFSEPSAFQKAFKKWTGMTPGEARKK